MPRLARLLTMVPVVILPLVVRIVDPASASTLSVEQGSEVLAKSKSIDSKCGFLATSERRELSGYLARAEVASQGMISGSAANAAISNGRAAGKAAKCGAGARQDVRDTVGRPPGSCPGRRRSARPPSATREAGKDQQIRANRASHAGRIPHPDTTLFRRLALQAARQP